MQGKVDAVQLYLTTTYNFYSTDMRVVYVLISFPKCQIIPLTAKKCLLSSKMSHCLSWIVKSHNGVLLFYLIWHTDFIISHRMLSFMEINVLFVRHSGDKNKLVGIITFWFEGKQRRKNLEWASHVVHDIKLFKFLEYICNATVEKLTFNGLRSITFPTGLWWDCVPFRRLLIQLEQQCFVWKWLIFPSSCFFFFFSWFEWQIANSLEMHSVTYCKRECNFTSFLSYIPPTSPALCLKRNKVPSWGLLSCCWCCGSLPRSRCSLS